MESGVSLRHYILTEMKHLDLGPTGLDRVELGTRGEVRGSRGLQGSLGPEVSGLVSSELLTLSLSSKFFGFACLFPNC